jgi:hypothetical protein
MKKAIVAVGLVMLSGCASNQRVDGLQRLVRAQEDVHRDFAQATLQAQRNTVERLRRLEIRVDDLADRVCLLEKGRGAPDTRDLDRKFKKYMSK